MAVRIHLADISVLHLFLWGAFAWMLLNAMHNPAFGQQPVEGPVKIDLEINEDHVLAQETVPVTVRLKGAMGTDEAARTNTDITVLISYPNAEPETKTVTIGSGETYATFEFTPKSDGVLSLTATQDHLLSGDEHIFALPPMEFMNFKKPGHGTINPGQVSRPPVWAENPSMALPQKAAVPTIPDRAHASAPSPGRAPASMPSSDRVSASAPPQASLSLSTFPKDKTMSGELNGTTIMALLDSPAPAQEPITLTLQATHGKLANPTLTIAPGARMAQTKWWAEKGGDGVVFVKKIEPSLTLSPENPIHMHFVPFIAGLRLSVYPQDVSIIDTAKVLGNLVGPDGKPVPTEEDRTVKILPLDSTGKVEPLTIIIPANASNQSANFMPQWPGEGKIQAVMDQYEPQNAEVRVNFPYVPLILLASFGFLGGLAQVLIFYRNQTFHPRDLLLVPLGCVSGIGLYIAGYLGRDMSFISQSDMSHPLAMILVSLAGGFAGEGFFQWLIGLFVPRAS